MAHGMTSEGTALALHRLLEAEGVVLHAALHARALPSMGGGMGIVLKEPLAAGTTLARFPFHCMITARKARFNLAMAEVALELRAVGDATACADALRVVPFTARVWSSHEYESRIRSQRVRNAIDAKVDALASALDSTETVVCYVLLMAALHGRWSVATTRSAASQEEITEVEEGQGKGAPISSGQPAPVLRFTHENAWMRTWVHALPAQYDNLLELAPQKQEGTADALAASSSSPPPPPLMRATASYTTTPTWLRSYVGLQRFRSAVTREQHGTEQRYATCCAALRCLQCLPTGVEEKEGEAAVLSTSASTMASSEKGGVVEKQGHQTGSEAPAREGQACTLGQFLWAFNTLMSRGFFFPEETWAMMPYVDYFNYALDSNAVMYPEEDDPYDEQGFTNRVLRSRSGGGDDNGSGVAALPAHAPRKQPRRTGLRSVRVGGQAPVPLANYHTYEFQLVEPTRAKDEQVLLHYGAYSDVELLMWYGFTLRSSLLPTAHLPPRPDGGDAAATPVSYSPVPLLPPFLEDAEGGASKTALALRQLLPRVVQAETRVALFNTCIASSTANDASALEEAYNAWCSALGRAYRLPLSPLADAEGNYPTAVCGATWLDDLLHAFAQTPALVPPARDILDDDDNAAAACRVDAWMRRWAAERWPTFSGTAFPHLNKDCGLGVLGLSPGLYAAVHTSFWAPRSGRLALSPQERVWLVRGLAWAELYVNATTPSEAAAPTPPTACQPASTAAAAFARAASVDQWALLRFLALEGTEAALEEYVAYVSDR